jgi:hypothetical protein
MNFPSSSTVASGRVAVTRLSDLGEAVDLDRVERELRESTSRPRFTRARPKAVFYARPPVDLSLGRVPFEIGGRTREVEVRARIYDFGAARVSYEVLVTSLPWHAYVDLVNQMEAMLEIPQPWQRHLELLRQLIGPAIERPAESGQEVTHVFATIHGFEPALSATEVLSGLDLVPLLTGDVRPLSAPARQDVLRHAHSYYLDDLVVIGSYRALIVEPGGEPDVADILEIAQAQLLEMFYYNDRLDAELPRMYDRIEQARERFAGLARRRYASLARSLHALLAEVTEVSERVENALVVTEDAYLAKVYGAALEQYRVRDVATAVDRKLAIIRDTYTALYDEATAARAEYLEMAIVLLIVFEIVLAFVI